MKLAQQLAPEEIRAGDFVAVLHVVEEFLPLTSWYGEDTRPPEMRQVQCRPREPCGPFRVVSVCLPFVLVKRPDGAHCSLDVRRYRLARLSRRFGKKAFERLAKKPAEASEAPCSEAEV